MITTELLELLEITRKLVNRKAELDKAYFDQFIKPAWDLFIQIHENYKMTFPNANLLTTSQKEFACQSNGLRYLLAGGMR